MTRSRCTSLRTAAIPSALTTCVIARGRTAKPPFGNAANAVVKSSGVTTPDPSDSDGTSGRSRRPTSDARRSTGREPIACWSSGGGAVVRLDHRLADRQRVRRLAARVARRPLLRPLRLDVRQTGQHRHRRVAVLERGREEKRLERGAGLAPAARRAVELRLPEVASADQRQHVAGRRIDRHERRLQLRAAEPAKPVGDRPLGRLLQRRHERRLHLPVGRMVAAELVAELLAQVLLGVAAARIDGARVRPDPDARAPRRPLLLGRDEAFLPHPREHDVAAFERAVEVRPRRQRRRRARQAGDQRRLRQRQRLRRTSEQVPRHRLDAVDAGAQVDPVQVQLEDLVLRELRVDVEREHRLADLAAVGFLVRQEERARELLRQRAGPLRRPGREVPDHRAPERDRIDAEVAVEAMVLDRDERVPQVFRDLGERHVVPVLVQAEPPLAVRREEPGVADAAAQLVHDVGLPHQPGEADGADEHERDEEPGSDPVAKRAAHSAAPGRPRRAWSQKESTV